jgi:fucose permease
MRMFDGLAVHKRRLYLLLLFNFMLFGVTLTIVGASIPEIIRTFGWSYTVTGIVLAAGSVGYFLSTFLCGFLMNLIGAKRVLVAGLLVEAAALFFFARFPSSILNLAFHFFIGFGQGAMEVVPNYEVIKIERHGESRLMSLMHSTFCIGAVLGPMAVGGFIRAGMHLNLVFRLVGLIIVGMALSVFPVPFIDDEDEAVSRKNKNRRILLDPLMLLFFFILLLYVGSEVGVTSWISEYFVKIHATQTADAAFLVSVLWVGIFTGRFSISVINKMLRQEQFLLVLACGSALFLLSTVLSKHFLWAGLFVFFTGLGFSGIYPVVMSLVGRYFRHGIAVGFASTGGGIGSFTFPFIFSLIAEASGLRGAFLFFITVNFLIFGLSFLVMKSVRDSRREQ